MDILFIIGRVLFALVLLNSGVMHLTKPDAMVGYAQFKKVPAAKASVALSGIIMVLASLGIILGIALDLSALVIAILLVIMSVKMHDFWNADEQGKQAETVNFFKNMSMAGAALMMFAAVANALPDDRVLGWMLTNGVFAK
ncbi:MAG: DoxX family protein [Ilumatobacteraceae bacterium]